MIKKIFTIFALLNVVLSSFYPALSAVKTTYAVEEGYCQDGWTFKGGDAGDDSNWEETGCSASQDDNEQRRQEEEQRQRQEEERQREKERARQEERERRDQEEQQQRKREQVEQDEKREAEEDRQREQQEERNREEEERERESERQRNEEQREQEQTRQEEQQQRRKEEVEEEERARQEAERLAQNSRSAQTQPSYTPPEPDPNKYYVPPPKYDTSFTAPVLTQSQEEEEASQSPDSKMGLPALYSTYASVYANRSGCSNPDACAQVAQEKLRAQVYAQAEKDAAYIEQVKTNSIAEIERNQSQYPTAAMKYEAMLNTYNYYKRQLTDTSQKPAQRDVYSAVVAYAQSQLESLRSAADTEARESADQKAKQEKVRRQELAQQEIEYADNYVASRPAHITESQIKKHYLDDRIKVYTEARQKATSESTKTDYTIKINTLKDYFQGVEQEYNKEQAAGEQKKTTEQAAELQQEKDTAVQNMKDYLDKNAPANSDKSKQLRKDYANHFFNEYKKTLDDSNFSERNKEINKAIIAYLEKELKVPQTAMEILRQRQQEELKQNPANQDKVVKTQQQTSTQKVSQNQQQASATRQSSTGTPGVAQTIVTLSEKATEAVENLVEKAADFVEDLLGGSDETKQGFNLIPEALAQTTATSSADTSTATNSATPSNSKTIQLIPGWNLITLPGIPTKPMTASVLLQDIALQQGYATTISKLENGKWTSFVLRGDSEFGADDFIIEPGKSYFVKALQESMYLMFESLDFVAPVKLNVSQGWNAVGFPHTALNYSASLLIDKINEDAVAANTLARWESGLWDTFLKQQQEEYGENFAIETNRGYLLKVKKRGTISL